MWCLLFGRTSKYDACHYIYCTSAPDSKGGSQQGSRSKHQLRGVSRDKNGTQRPFHRWEARMKQHTHRQPQLFGCSSDDRAWLSCRCLLFSLVTEPRRHIGSFLVPCQASEWPKKKKKIKPANVISIQDCGVFFFVFFWFNFRLRLAVLRALPLLRISFQKFLQYNFKFPIVKTYIWNFLGA